MAFKTQVRAGLDWVFSEKQKIDIFPTLLTHRSSPETWPWHVGITHCCSANYSHGCGHISPLAHFFRVKAHSCCFLSISCLHHGLVSIRTSPWDSAACSKVLMCNPIGPTSLNSLIATTISCFFFQLVLMSQLENQLGELLQCALGNLSD